MSLLTLRGVDVEIRRNEYERVSPTTRMTASLISCSRPASDRSPARHPASDAPGSNP